MIRILAILIGYLFGLIQSSFIIGKLEGIDIRNYGSGNAGATNAIRILGKKKGTIVFILDVLKAILAFFVSILILDSILDSYFPYSIIIGIYAGLGAVLGHCFPFYMKFKGGKGIACAIGIMISIDLLISLTLIMLCIAIVIFKKYISLGSIAFVSLSPIFLSIYSFSFEVILVSTLIGLICIYLHKSNIIRLFKGTEMRIDEKIGIKE